MTDSTKLPFWAIVEIMGHNTFAGLVSEENIGGAVFCRVDVPRTTKCEPFSKLFGAQAIYCLTPVSEQVAKLRAEALNVSPITDWDLPDWARQKLRSQVAALPAPPQREDLFDDSDNYDSVSEADFRDIQDPGDMGPGW